jgi:hypothetical protein
MVYYHIVQISRSKWMMGESYHSNNANIDDMMNDDETKYFVSKDAAIEFVGKTLGV